MTPTELRELAGYLISRGCSERCDHNAAAYLRTCADALEAGPVAWKKEWPNGSVNLWDGQTKPPLEIIGETQPLYLRPLPAQVQPLRLPEPMTDEDIYNSDEIMEANCFAGLLFDEFAIVVRIIEAAVMRRVREANE